MVLREHTELGRKGTTDMLSTDFVFHSQFQLEYDRYRDNNNFIRPNIIHFTIDRWSLLPKEYENIFLDFI